MKDGKRAKTKASKKASGQKVRPQKPRKSESQARAGAKKPAQASRASAAGKGKPAQKVLASKISGKTSGAPARSGTDGREKGTRGAAGNGGFTNSVIAAAFKRAIKKYSTALRHLTD